MQSCQRAWFWTWKSHCRDVSWELYRTGANKESAWDHGPPKNARLTPPKLSQTRSVAVGTGTVKEEDWSGCMKKFVSLLEAAEGFKPAAVITNFMDRDKERVPERVCHAMPRTASSHHRALPVGPATGRGGPKGRE